MTSPIFSAALENCDTVEISRTITECDVQAFAELSGDCNSLHTDDSFARGRGYRGRVVHGMLVASLVSTLIGTRLPGHGALWTQQTFRWRKPVFIEDTITVRLRVKHRSQGTGVVLIEVHAVNQRGEPVMDGEGAVLAKDTIPAL